VFLEKGKPARQYALAEKKGVKWLIIPGESPLEDPLAVRDLVKRENREGLSLADIVTMFRAGAD